MNLAECISILRSTRRQAGLLLNLVFVCAMGLAPCTINAQPVYTLTDTVNVFLENYAVLPDKGYDIQKITSDKSLRFAVNDSLLPEKANFYWMRLIIKNPLPHPQSYLLRMYPNLKNVLYYFDIHTRKWVSQTAGILANEKNRNWGAMNAILQGSTDNTLYVKVGIKELRQFHAAIEPKIALMKKATADQYEQNLWIGWIAGIIVLLLFFLNNLYVYWSFRDNTVLYYLIAQLGGMLYLTAYWQFFHVFIPSRVFTLGLHPFLNYYDLNSLLMHFGIVMTLYGFTALTRSYLKTRETLHRLDQFLRIGFFIYLVFSVFLLIANVFLFLLERYTLLYDNILALLLILLVIYTCVAGYRRRLPAAAPFLFANLLPLAFMLGIPLYHVFVSYNTGQNLYLPNFVIISQSLGFSIALVARTKSIQNELRTKELEARRLEFELTEIALRHDVTELQNEKISAEMTLEKSRNELLKQNLDANQRELASMAMYTAQKNELLADLRKQLRSLEKAGEGEKNKGLKGVNSILRSNLYLDSDWRKFKLHFEKVHPHFFEDLRNRYPNLSKNEERLCAYFHINLSTKEIAALFNIDPASVYRAKTRLTKKMTGLSAENIGDEAK